MESTDYLVIGLALFTGECETMQLCENWDHNRTYPVPCTFYLCNITEIVLIFESINNPLVAFFLEAILSLSAKVVFFGENVDKDVKLLRLPQLVFFPIGDFLSFKTWWWGAQWILFDHMWGNNEGGCQQWKGIEVGINTQTVVKSMTSDYSESRCYQIYLWLWVVFGKPNKNMISFLAGKLSKSPKITCYWMVLKWCKY